MSSFNSFRLSIIIVSLFLPSGVQSALQADDEFTNFKDCLKVQDEGVRFACYESFAKGVGFSQKKIEAVIEVVKAKEEVKKKKTFGAVKKAKADDLDRVTVTIIAFKKMLRGDLVFTTSDNQVWRQTNSGRFRKVKVPFQAVIKKRLMGGYFLSPVGSNSSVGVKRVK